MIKNDQFRKEALKAIAAAETNPFTRALGLVPVVQVRATAPVTFPSKFKFVGMNKQGEYVYNLDAVGILQRLDYEALEFDIEPKKPAEGGLDSN